MSIKSVLLIVNHALLPSNVQSIIPKQAVAILGIGDSFADGIKKFLYSFYTKEDWFRKEELNKTLCYFEPTSLEGIWKAEIYINKQYVDISGIFRCVDYVAF
jgi:hypothetical protein